MGVSMSTVVAIAELYDKIRIRWRNIEREDQVDTGMCLRNTGLAAGPDLVAEMRDCRSDNAYLAYFFKQAGALQQEHLVAKAAHEQTTFRCVVNETSIQGTEGTGFGVKMAVQDHRLTVKEYDALLLDTTTDGAGGEAVRTSVRKTSKAVPGVSPETIWIAHRDEELHLRLEQGAMVKVRTVYNELPLARELVALHEFVLSCMSSGGHPFQTLVPETPVPDAPNVRITTVARRKK